MTALGRSATKKIAASGFYIACPNNDMFRLSSGCALSYYKANCTLYSVFDCVDEISFTSIKFAFKILQ
jgi:hypothetical protein